MRGFRTPSRLTTEREPGVSAAPDSSTTNDRSAAGARSVLVLGTGAMACYLAARLFRAAVPVTLAGSWPEALAAISARGVRVTEGGATWSAAVPALSIEGPLPASDVVVVLTKAYQTATIAPHAARALARGGAIVTLQNGWGNRESLCLAAPGRVAAGVAFAGIRVLAPGEVQGTAGRLVVQEGGALAAPLARFLSALSAAALPVEAAADIEPHLWSKLAVNCAINPLTALGGHENGHLLENAALRAEVVTVAREVDAVATARGVSLPGDSGDLALDVASATASNRSSMLQDLDRAAPTEIDALCGAVVREGLRLGVRTPRNERLWRAVKAVEPTVRVHA